MDANTDRIPSVVKLCDLYYIVNDERIPLPEWCLSLLDLGKRLAMIESTASRVVIALAVPTRAFASVLIATGMIIANSTKQLDSLTRNQHLKHISSLKPGTNVVYRDSKREFKGKVASYDKVDGELVIKIQIGIIDYRSFRLRDCASYITVSEREVKFRDYQKVKSVKTPGEFLKSFLGDTYAKELMSRTEFECLIVGQRSAIESEVLETKIGFENSQSSTLGSLQEVLRIREFLRPDQPYRCSVISSSSADISEEMGDLHPSLVIFDSAHAFIKHNHNWPSIHCVAILDRTERSFMEAVGLLNQNYINRVENELFEFSLNLPDSIEAMVFQERC